MGEPKPNPVCRVVVFIDYRNVYEDFRRAFVTGTILPSDGQFRPSDLGTMLASRGPDFEEWRWAQTRVYTGRPSSSRDPRAAGAADRQIQTWRDAGALVMPRPLQYLSGQQPRQKGVDVELAVDVVSMAHENKYEIGIIASTDTDLVPAIEAVERHRNKRRTPRICVVRYEGMGKRLSLPDTRATQPHAFLLTKTDFEAVRDPTVYIDPRPPPP